MKKTETKVGKIRKIRELRDITQDSMAKQLGMTQQNYSELEKGKVGISEERLEQITKILGLNGDGIDKFDEKIIFNNTNCTFSDNAHNMTNGDFKTFLDEIKKPYQSLIEQLQQENIFLKSLLEKK